MKHTSVALIVLLITFPSMAQQAGLETMKTFYKSQETQGCLKIYLDESPKSYQIILIRHGQPNLNKKGWRGRNQAVQYASAYDTVGIVPFDKTLHCLENITTDEVYHSSLPRARHTARLLFGENSKFIEDGRFREFERKVMKFINVKMPLGFWLGTSRILWLMGMNDKGIETFQQAKTRARENALFLAEQAKKGGQVILVAHGLHNRYVMKYLRKQGWELVRKGGSKYLAVNVLANTSHPDR